MSLRYKLTIHLIILFIGLANLGCSNKARVLIKVKVQSEIDVNKYKKLAIIPFLDSSRNKGGELAEHIAFLLRRKLSKSSHLEILDTKETREILAGEKIDLNTLKDENALVDLGGQLEVDALIVGSYKFYDISEPRRMYYDRYSLQLQRYVTDTVTYFHKSYVLSLRIFIVNANTGKAVWKAPPYEETASENHNLGTLLISEVSGKNSITKELASRAVTKFIRQIAPHYETEERILIK